MIAEANLPYIKKGDTYILPFEFFEDACGDLPLDVSGYTFKLMAKNSSGVTQFTWANADFVIGATTNQRTITLTSVTTATYNVGDFAYDLQVTEPSGTFTWMSGYISVIDQITS
jgi:hypothetical protein